MAKRKWAKVIPGIDDDWLQGFAAGLAEASRLNHDHQAVRHAMKVCGVTFPDLVRADVAAVDVNELRKKD